MGKSSKNGESLSQSRSSGSVSFLLLFCSNIFGVEMRNFLPKKPHLLRNLLQQQILAQNSAQDPIFHQLRNLKSHWLKMWVSKSQLTLQKKPGHFWIFQTAILGLNSADSRLPKEFEFPCKDLNWNSGEAKHLQQVTLYFPRNLKKSKGISIWIYGEFFPTLDCWERKRQSTPRSY